tara:strand:+ start:41391 stop:43250 length:1860 start_codon:yes stop_codon:yes gene_type:complete
MTRFNSDIEFVHGSGQVLAPTGDLTLRTDDLAIPRSVIIGSGATLRPERDAINRLGTPDSRWYDGWIGDLHSLSGTLGGPTQTFSWTVGGFLFNASNVNFTSATVGLDTNSTMTIEAASELNSDGIVRFNTGSQIEMDTLMDTSVDHLGTIGQKARRMARVHASSGIFNELSPQESGTFISVDASLIPADDAVYSLGVPGSPGDGEGSPIPPIRWANVVAASGHFNSIYASTSGVPVGHAGAYIELGASLIPPAHAGSDALFWIGGGKFNQFAGIRAVSGILNTVSITTAAVSTMSVTNLTINNTGDFINTGLFDWDLGASNSTISNGTWAFDNTVDVEFDKRPTALGSGVMLSGDFVNVGSSGVEVLFDIDSASFETHAYVPTAGVEAVGDSEQYYVHYAEFVNGNVAANGLSTSSSGTGTGTRQLWEFVTSGGGESLGVVELGTGTTSTGYLSINTGNNAFRLGEGITSFGARVCPWTLSTATDEYICKVGFGNDITSGGLGNSACGFRYDRVGDGVNWRCITRNGGTETNTDSGVVVLASATGTNMVSLSFTVNDDGTSVEFFIDGVSVATHTTNIPTNNARVGYGVEMEATAYTSLEPRLGVDWTKFTCIRSTPR